MPTNPNMVAIQTVTVGAGGASSISFTSIPQTYTDLLIKYSVRDNTSGGGVSNNLWLQFNGSGGTAYSGRLLYGNGSSALSASNSSNAQTIFQYATSEASTASTFASGEIYVPNYTSSNNKSINADSVTETNATGVITAMSAGLWANSAAITSVTLTPATGSLVQYSTATLFGVTSAGYGAKATGGIITQDANYYYHTFLASGTFTPTSNITADYLVVAGGGGGGGGQNQYAYGGGGGAGGLRCTVTATGGGGSLESALSLTASTNYTVTVGGGGAADTNGSNSVFSSITSTGGGRGGNTTLTATGATGGSGGGGAGASGQTYAGGAGTTNQGYAGGSSISGTPFTGGGGGAGEAGNTDGQGLGGDGVATSISGSSVTYAGGGSGGFSSVRAGGDGGGGAGGGTGINPVAGTANTGGGGGGSTDATSFNTGAAGGSGIVIVRYAK